MADNRIAIIRHGQTAWSLSGQHTSVTEIPLTAIGVAEAREVPGVLAGLGIHPATVWCSPRQRARATAAAAGLPVDQIVEELAEWDYGSYEGRTTAQIRAERPGWSLFTDGCPGGESPVAVVTRAGRLLARVRDHWRTTPGDVVLVGHGHISRVLAVTWVGLDVTAAGAIDMSAAAVTVLGSYHGEPIIDHANVIPLTVDRSATPT